MSDQAIEIPILNNNTHNTVSYDTTELLKNGTFRRIKILMQWMEEVIKIDPELQTRTARLLAIRIEKAVRRSIYGVKQKVQWAWNGVRMIPLSKYSQDRLDVEGLLYVEIQDMDTLRAAVYKAKKKDYTFLGAKVSGGSKTSGNKIGPRVLAVFFHNKDFEESLTISMGSKIARHILEKNNLKDLQNAVGLLCRIARRPIQNKKIIWPTTTVTDTRPDGLIARFSPEEFQKILSCWILPKNTRWLQVTILDRENGNATKGAIMQCEADEEPQSYSASWKFLLGKLTVVHTNNMLVHNADSLYRPHPSMCLQQLVYNHTETEIELLIKKLFVPAINKLTDFQHFANTNGCEKLMALGVAPPLPLDEDGLSRSNRFHLNMIHDTATRPKLHGFRVKAAWDGSLTPFQVKVPNRYSKMFHVEDQIDITRDPSLPVGNSTQRYTIVGYTEGNYIRLNEHPWTTIQAGDYDGDDASCTNTTIYLMPRKVYNQTTMKVIERPKSKPFKGVKKLTSRIAQAIRVSAPAMGPFDIRARKMIELKCLNPEMSLELSQGAHAEIMSMKHNVEKMDIPELPCDPDHKFAISAIREQRWHDECIQGTLYQKIADAVQQVKNTWLPTGGIDQNKIIIPEAPTPVLLRCHELANIYQDTFRSIASSDLQNKDQHFDRLALRICLKLDKIGSQNPLYRKVMAAHLAKYCNGNLLCKVLQLKELAEVVAGALVKL